MSRLFVLRGTIDGRPQTSTEDMNRPIRSFAVASGCALFVGLCFGGCDDEGSTHDEVAEQLAEHVGLEDYEVHAATDVHREAAENAFGRMSDGSGPSGPRAETADGFTAPVRVFARVHCGDFETGAGDGECGYCSFKGRGRDETNCFANESACGEHAGMCVTETWFDPTKEI